MFLQELMDTPTDSAAVTPLLLSLVLNGVDVILSWGRGTSPTQAIGSEKPPLKPIHRTSTSSWYTDIHVDVEWRSTRVSRGQRPVTIVWEDFLEEVYFDLRRDTARGSVQWNKKGSKSGGGCGEDAVVCEGQEDSHSYSPSTFPDKPPQATAPSFLLMASLGPQSPRHRSSVVVHSFLFFTPLLLPFPVRQRVLFILSFLLDLVISCLCPWLPC